MRAPTVTTFATLTIGLLFAVQVHVVESRQTDDRLCLAALQLINRDELGNTFLPLRTPAIDERSKQLAYETRTEEIIVGAYEFDLNATMRRRLWLVRQGGSCDSTGLRVPDGEALAIDQRMIDESLDHGLHTRLATVAGEVVAVVFTSDPWNFTPLALARWQDDRLVPTCAFAASGVKRVQVSAPADPVCSAFIGHEVQVTDWQEVTESEFPESPIGGLIDAAARAELDWTGEGKKRATWWLSYFSGAGCGMTYQWIALDNSSAERSAVDDRSNLAGALFAKTPGRFWQRRPWNIDSVFTYQERAWLAGQPQQEDIKKYNYAVYSFDRDGAHVQCRYHLLPQYEIEQRGFGNDRISE